MSGHYICDSCGYDGNCADYCKYRRPLKEQWKGNMSRAEVAAMKHAADPQQVSSTMLASGDGK